MASKPSGPLRRGWTTGACAAAATSAAYTALLTGAFPDPVSITLPKGQQPSFPLAREFLDSDSATAGIAKDAGDDPDVTHGALVLATVRHGATGQGTTFRAGDGVGTVTRAGLPLAVGEAAINPAPRRMIAHAVDTVAARYGGSGDVDVTIAIPGGAELAKRTMNGRLGIAGGLSVLGTTGIVTPYSCAAWIASIHQGIDVARAAGIVHAAAATGSTSEAAVRRMYNLPDIALLDMGDFAGGLLKYLRKHPLPKLTIAGGFAKIGKLAAGHMDLHSGRSQVDFDRLAARMAELGGSDALVDECRRANTANHALALARAAGLPLGNVIAAGARQVARELAPTVPEIEVVIFDRAETLVGRAGA